MTLQTRLLPVTLITWVLLAATASTPTVAQEVPAWAQERLDEWYAALNAQDAERFADLYSPDARFGWARGRAAIISKLESDWADMSMTCSGAFDGFQVVGDLATGWGRATCTETPKAGGPSSTFRTRWLGVYERQANGRWLILRGGGELEEP